MTDSISYQTTVARDYIPGLEFMLMEADFAPLFDGYEDYLSRHDLARPPREALEAVRAGLAAAVLWATYQPSDSMLAWSLSLPEERWRLFFGVECGEPARAVARWSAFDSHHHCATPLFDAQLRRRNSAVQNSSFDPTARGMPAIVDEFFVRAHQNPGRFFMSPGASRAQMLIALADFDASWLAAVNEQPCTEPLPAHMLGERKAIHTPMAVTFACGCSPEKIRKVVLAAARDDVPAVFGNEVEVQVECPRCGREVAIRRP